MTKIQKISIIWVVMFQLKFIIKYSLIVLFTVTFIWLVLVRKASLPQSEYFETELIKKIKAQASTSFDCHKVESALFDEIIKVGSEYTLKSKKIDLTTFAKNFTSNNFYLLELNSQLSPEDVGKIIPILKSSPGFSNFLFNSNSDGVLKFIRELSPESTIGTGYAELTRFKALKTLGLAQLINLKNDFVVLNPNWQNGIFLKYELILELKKQQKPIFIGPVTDQGKISPKLLNSVQGMINCATEYPH